MRKKATKRNSPLRPLPPGGLGALRPLSMGGGEAAPKKARTATRSPEQSVAVNIESEDAEDFYPAVVELTGTVTVDGSLAGTWSATLIDRPNSSNFHTLCDSVSQDLQVCGVSFCDRSGKPRLQALKSNPVASSGGFLYIGNFSMQERWRQGGNSDIGSAAVTALLDALAGRWTLAVYICDSSAQESASEGGRDHSLQAMLAGPSDEEKTAIRRRMRMDGNQFLRAGFEETREVNRTKSCFYLHKVSNSQAPALTHEEAAAVDFYVDPALSGEERYYSLK